MTPIRIQRKRTKGFKLPIGTICVTRGTKYGNPFRVVKIGKEWFVKCSDSQKQAYILIDNCRFAYQLKSEAVTDSIKCYKIWINYIKLDLTTLRGHNLACWCALSDNCHADYLLSESNV